MQWLGRNSEDLRSNSRLKKSGVADSELKEESRMTVDFIFEVILLVTTNRADRSKAASNLVGFDLIFRILHVDIEVFLQHVHYIERYVNRDDVWPLLAEVSCLVKSKKSEDLAHDHWVRNVSGKEKQ
jgi:hypothetical protein